jgi:DNA-binding response OmpR family regulator
MRILLAEDDGVLASALQEGLASERYEVQIATEGPEALRMAVEQNFDLLILDLGLPRLDGLQVLASVREQKPEVPILVLTARFQEEDRVRGLDAGADDYLTKPFSLRELKARVRALMRRAAQRAQARLQVADLVLDRVERRVERGQRQLSLTPKEYALLELLMQNAGRTVSRAEIRERLWKSHAASGTNIVDVYITYLRRKVDSGFAFPLIHTCRGVGYRLEARPSVASGHQTVCAGPLTKTSTEGVSGESPGREVAPESVRPGRG